MKKATLSIIVVTIILNSSFAQEKRYTFESAVIEKRLGTRGAVSSIVYIDDYGRKELTESIMRVPNQPNNTLTMVTMIKDGYIYYTENTSNEDKTAQKRGTKIKMATKDDYTMINYLNLTDEVKQKYQIEEKDDEQLLGMDCKRYELTATSPIGRSIKASVWVWQGLVLKLTFTVGDITVIQEEVTTIQEDETIAKEKFDLPEEVMFLERDF